MSTVDFTLNRLANGVVKEDRWRLCWFVVVVVVVVPFFFAIAKSSRWSTNSTKRSNEEIKPPEWTR